MSPPAASTRLVVFVHGDFTALENGAQVRCAELVGFVARTFPNVAVYSHYEHPSHPWTDESVARFAARFPGTPLVLDHVGAGVALLTRLKNILVAAVPALAPLAVRYGVPGATPQYDAMKRAPDAHLFILNFVDSFTWLNGFPFRAVVETHDVKHLKYQKRYGLAANHWRVAAKRRSELALLSRAEAIVAIGQGDAQLFRDKAANRRIFFVPAYGAGQPAGCRAQDHGHAYDLLFTGADNNFNVDGLAGFLQQSRAWLGGRRIAVAGRVCEAPAIREIAAGWPELELLGFVPDLAPVYAASKAVISPVEGTGLKIKVVDALAHGKPVLASAHSREGLPPGFEACVLPLERDVVLDLLDNPQRLAAAASAAVTYHLQLQDAGDRRDLTAFIGARLADPATRRTA